MQTARHLVGGLVELAARVQDRHHDLQGGFVSVLGVFVHGNAAAVVLDGHAVVDMHRNFDGVAGARQGLVNAVIDHLVDQMMEAARARVADVHGGPLSNGLQPFEHLNGFCTVTIFAHYTYLKSCCGRLRPFGERFLL